MRTFYKMLIIAILPVSVVWALSCSGDGKTQESKPPRVIEEKTEGPEDAVVNIEFTGITVKNYSPPPVVEIIVDPTEHPRLITDTRSAKFFAKYRGEPAYEALMAMALKFWEGQQEGESEFRPANPGIMAASAFAAVNREYLALAIGEIDRALAPGEGFTSAESLEGVAWAAIGWDILGGMMSEPDKATIANTARLALDDDLLPYLGGLLDDRNLEVSPNDIRLADGNLIRALSAAFLWEMALSDDTERITELLVSSSPVFETLQAGLEAYLDIVGFEFLDGPVDDGLLMACLAWEKACGSRIIDRELLGRTLRMAYAYCSEQLDSEPPGESNPDETKAALMHLVKWRDMLSDQDRDDVNRWVEETGYSPQALMHIFLKQTPVFK